MKKVYLSLFCLSGTLVYASSTPTLEIGNIRDLSCSVLKTFNLYEQPECNGNKIIFKSVDDNPTRSTIDTLLNDWRYGFSDNMTKKPEKLYGAAQFDATFISNEDNKVHKCTITVAEGRGKLFKLSNWYLWVGSKANDKDSPVNEDANTNAITSHDEFDSRCDGLSVWPNYYLDLVSNGDFNFKRD